MKGQLFSKNMKLAEIVHQDFRILYLLPRFGIRLRFGEATVSDICRKHEIDESLFLLIINTYTCDAYTPKLSDMSSIPLEGIMAFLKQSHADYLHNRIPHIIGHIYNLADESHARERMIIEQFCENYNKEMVTHFEYEEKIVFPYIESLIAGTCDPTYRIDLFTKNHTNLDDKLHDLKNIIMKYVEPSVNEEINRDLLVDLFLLEEDLKRHTVIEDKILVSLVESREQNPTNEV